MKNNIPIIEDSIRREAYFLSEKAGHPPGTSEFFWLQAEALVLGKAASSGRRLPSKNGGKKTMPKKEAKQGPAAPAERKTRAGKAMATK